MPEIIFELCSLCVVVKFLQIWNCAFYPWLIARILACVRDSIGNSKIWNSIDVDRGLDGHGGCEEGSGS